MGSNLVQRRQEIDGVVSQQTLLLPTVDMLEAKIKVIPAAHHRSLNDIEAELAKEHGADAVCTETLWRNLKVVAVIAHSAATMKDPETVPFWRAIDPDQIGADRLAGGRGFIMAQRAREKRAQG